LTDTPTRSDRFASDVRRIAAVEVAVLLYDGVRSTDVLAPWAALRHVPAARIRFVGAVRRHYRSDDPPFSLLATDDLRTVTRPEVVVIPGGEFPDDNVVAWLRTVPAPHRMLAVSSGIEVLARAGLVGAAASPPAPGEVVEDATTVCAAGGSAAFEAAVLVARREAGDAVADTIRTRVGVDPKVLDLAGPQRTDVIERWRRDLHSSLHEPSRWRRLVDRLRHGSVVIVPDDTSASGPSSAPLPKGWNRRRDEDTSGQ
jgi:putative intracellular protease/amidase